MGSLLGLPKAAVLLVLQLLWAGSCPDVSGIGTTAGAAPGAREGLAGGVLQRGLAPGDGEGAAAAAQRAGLVTFPLFCRRRKIAVEDPDACMMPHVLVQPPVPINAS